MKQKYQMIPILIITLLISSLSANDFNKNLKEYNKKYGLLNPYNNSKSAKENYADAVKLLTLKANQNHAGAQFLLGHMYRNAIGVKQDFKEAVRLWTLSANQGNSDAQYHLANFYKNAANLKKTILKQLDYTN